ncbi:MAG: adenylate/guanylate cyclase domain-containing protein [Candidatus Kapabacteria bacterium]|nr:adenylate/guanylate cyclase domain-containing protein [Candidatus Kapabacteria bacterium]
MADSFEEASIVFIDIVGFTKSSATQDPKRVAEVLNIIYTKLDHIAKKYNLEKIKTIGDCYMAASGLPIADPKNAEKAANFAKEAMQMLHNYDTGDGTIIRFRCGLDCGPVVAGVIGEHKFIYDVWGDTVNMAARMEQNGEPDRIHTTERFKNKISSVGVEHAQPNNKFTFTSRGEMEIKGKGLVTTYFMG